MQRLFRAVVFSVFALCSPATALADWTINDAVNAVIEEAIKPALSRYHLQTMSMSASIDALCAEPGAGTLAASRDQFGRLVEAWGQVEFVRIGPLTSENRLERTLYWPDRKGRGLRQVRMAIAQEQQPVAAVETLSKQSVAVQGLSALEFVLFGDESGTLETRAEHRCNYGKSIAENLSNIAGELIAAWEAEDGFANLWRNPSPDNALFRDADEQLRALLKLVSQGSEIIRVQRLDPFLDSEPFNAKRALFWRSGKTFTSLNGNFDGLQNIVLAAKLDDIVGGNDGRVVDGLSFELSNAKRTLAETQISVETLASESNAMSRVKYLRIVTQSLIDLSGKTIPAIFGLSSGFSSLDGD
ncbi:MAG: imelysin family protein [Pseudomonadota bacterium]